MFLGARAAIGVWWNHHHHLNISAPILELNKQTNNSAEIQAATEAVRVAKASDVKRLCINTDSQFLINCITSWIKNWKKRGWITAANTPVKNKEDLMLLDEELSDPSIEVTWNHVRGHAGIEGNEMADSLARAGIRKWKKIRVKKFILASQMPIGWWAKYIFMLSCLDFWIDCRKMLFKRVLGGSYENFPGSVVLNPLLWVEKRSLKKNNSS